MKFTSREQLLNLADRNEIKRYNDGRIDRIDSYIKNRKVHTTQAVYSTFNGMTRITDVQGLLFPEVWNSVETPELNWFDRNPKPIFLSYNANLANHALTERWTYTVPEGRKFFAEVTNLYIFCSSVATFPSFLLEGVNYTPSGSTAKIIFALTVNAQVFGIPYSQSTGQSFLLFQGDKITADTTNQGDGAGDFLLSLKGTEFDA